MRAAMCFSHFQLPRCQIHTLYGSWWKKVNTFTQTQQYISNSRLLGFNIHNLQGGHSRRWTQKSASTSTGKDVLSRKKVNISQQITDVSSLTHDNLNTGRVELGESKSVHIEERISENKDISKNITVIVFDIETTGFRRDADRIIEIALQDLSGGENSTFQALVNPDMFVTNTEIHGITSSMLNKNGVPRMQELIPILIQYVKSRQKPAGQILLVSHNAKSFDVPFLMHEFNRCSYEIPSDWRFMDSLSLAREIKDLKKPEGATRLSRSLQNLREHYKIPLVGSAHRAMSDVKSLVLVLQKITCDLKLTVSCLLENYSFTVSDIINNSNSKKKKNSG
ncbi:exonuclease DPD1, chloroplastic/mitochondrial-like [Bidens hawaiensis]|uniref:exonuclease DPD1, chloroplastic/mitochondrial-like n=1 Tax=Bidens hawaiensis TaxID=980011 RepID=UPI00404975B5